MHVTGLGGVDRRLLRGIDHHRIGWVDDLTRAVMYVGTTPWTLIVCAVVLAAVVLRFRAYRPALAAVAAVVVADLAATTLKDVFERARPPAGMALLDVGGYSFPSTHAAMTSAFAVAILLSVPWPTARAAYAATAVLLGVVAFVGFCMVWLGAHWATDVLAGWVLGVAIGVALARLLRGRRTSAPVEVSGGARSAV